MNKNKFLVPLEQIKKAHQNIKPFIHRTDFNFEWNLSRLLDAKIYIKLENTQIVKSFKLRGAANALLNLSPEKKAKGVIAASAGNHAQGLAYSATKAGVRSIIVMPSNAPLSKINATINFGADVVLCPTPSFDDANKQAQQLAKDMQLTFVPPYDDLDVIAGQGTLALEMLEDVADLDVCICQIGGGGILAGVASAIKQINPQCKVIGVQSENFCAMKKSFDAHKIISYKKGPMTLADGMAVQTPGNITFEIIKDLVDDIVTVNEDEIAYAVAYLLEKAKIVTEGAGATGVAALLAKKVDVKNKKVGVIASGGNINLEKLISVINSTMTWRRRRVRLEFFAESEKEWELFAQTLKSTSAVAYNVINEQQFTYETFKDFKHCYLYVYFIEQKMFDHWHKKAEEFKLNYKLY